MPALLELISIDELELLEEVFTVLAYGIKYLFNDYL